MKYSYNGFRNLRIFPLFHFYLISWGDVYAAADVLKRIKRELLPGNQDEFNFSRVTFSRGGSIEPLTSVAEELPLLGEKRVVHVLGAQDLLADAKKRLADYLRNFPPATIAILGVEMKEEWKKERPMEGRGKDKESGEKTEEKAPENKEERGKNYISREVDEVLRQDGVFIDCTLTEAEVNDWLRERFRAAKREVRPATLHLMRERVGDSLLLLDKEFEKLDCYLGKRSEVRDKDIEAIVTRYPAAEIFELGDHLLTGKTQNALLVLEDLLNEEEGAEGKSRYQGAALKILGYLNSHYRTLNLILKYRGEGVPAPDMVRKMKIHPYRLRKLMEKITGLDGRQLASVFHLLHRADLGIKHGRDGRLILETLVIQICSGRADSAKSAQSGKKTRTGSNPNRKFLKGRRS
jgi:DNA polymerase III delta subunit